jgi:hypothetical protein
MRFQWRDTMRMHHQVLADSLSRRNFVSGSDARTIMSDDEAALLRLWREKRGEVEVDARIKTPGGFRLYVAASRACIDH